MASSALKHVSLSAHRRRRPAHPTPGHRPHNSATGTDRHSTRVAQPRYLPRCNCTIQYLHPAQACTRSQSTDIHCPSGLESAGLGPANERRPGNSTSCPRSSRCWRDSARVRSFILFIFWSSHRHSQLHSMRPPLPDVPAVYFVAPTLANIRRISEDLDKCLYESFHLNFVEPLPRALLEELAASVAASGTGESVEQVGLPTVLCWGRFHSDGPSIPGRRPVSIVYRAITISILLAIAITITSGPSRSISTQTVLLVHTPQLPVVD